MAEVLDSKAKDEIINAIIFKWVATGPGLPKKFLSDNGGEFNNAEYTNMCQNFNIVECKTAAESPWSNGLCERNHAVVDQMVNKMMDENPGTDLKTCLVWACHAKNCLQMHGGYSPYQLVFGRNPNLPSVLHDEIPALEGYTISETVGKHINHLHASRKAFVAAESCEKIRRALRHRIRSAAFRLEPNDSVYYKRNGCEKWKGPGKVLGGDKNVVFIRHGSNYVKVHPCRVIPSKNLPYSEATDVTFPKPASRCTQSTFGDTESTEVPNSDSDNEEATSVETVEREDEVPVVPCENATHTKNPVEFSSKHSLKNQQNTSYNKPKPKSAVSFKKCGENEWRHGIIKGHAGKQTGKHKNWLNVQESDESYVIDWIKDVDEWEYSENPEPDTHFIGIAEKGCDNEEIYEEKLKELEK